MNLEQEKLFNEANQPKVSLRQLNESAQELQQWFYWSANSTEKEPINQAMVSNLHWFNQLSMSPFKIRDQLYPIPFNPIAISSHLMFRTSDKRMNINLIPYVWKSYEVGVFAHQIQLVFDQFPLFVPNTVFVGYQSDKYRMKASFVNQGEEWRCQGFSWRANATK